MKLISCRVSRLTSIPPVSSPNPICVMTPPGDTLADASSRVCLKPTASTTIEKIDQLFQLQLRYIYY